MISTTSRIRGLALAVGLGCLALASCSSDASDGTDGTADSTATSVDTSGVASSTTIRTTSSSAFVTVAPSTTEAPTTTAAPLPPGSQIPTESRYTIQSGDFPSTVAAKFKVDMQEMLDLNGWELVGQQVPEWPLPGTEIRIPAGATVPGESVDTGTDDTTGDDGTASATSAATPTTVDVCATSTYMILEGDIPIRVAEKFDTTVAELDAINAETPGYSAFIAGITIKIPAKTTDC